MLDEQDGLTPPAASTARDLRRVPMTAARWRRDAALVERYSNAVPTLYAGRP
jgi:hypothetical protein